MPEYISDNFTADKNAETNAPIWLYEIDVVAGTLYFTEYPENVTFDGQVYLAAPISHGTAQEQLDGPIGGVSITIGDASGVIQAYLEHDEYDSLREEKVIVRQVFANHLANAADCIVDEYYIDTIAVDGDTSTVTFNTREKLDGMTVSLPRRKCPRFTCQWKYKGLGCWIIGSGTVYEAPDGWVTGSPDTCERNMADCIRHENIGRFGGFPGVPTSRMLYLV